MADICARWSRVALTSSTSVTSRAAAVGECDANAGADTWVWRCSVGHKGKFGHEFLEFEVRPDGLLRYANNSNYKKDHMIRKEGG